MGRRQGKTGPLLIGTTAHDRGGAIHWLEAKRIFPSGEKAPDVRLRHGFGLHDEVLSRCDIVRPAGGFGDYNHLSGQNRARELFSTGFSDGVDKLKI